MTASIDISDMRSNAGVAAQLLKALANEHRLLVLCYLLEGERSVGQLNAELDLSQSALSQHLAVLRKDGLVSTRREAQTIYYRVASPAVTRVLTALHDVYCLPRDAQAQASAQ
ncbi:MAG: metalloregulator ArsR/SmtB family transcription factor [Lysobacterales bacterium]